MRMRVISWNLNAIGAGARVAHQVELLAELSRDINTLIALQEVSPKHHEALSRFFPAASYACSFDLRPPRRYDGRNRAMGCAVAATGDLHLGSRQLVPETPLPERALVANVHLGNTQLLAGSFHAITGVGYKKAKPIMFQAIARFLEDCGLPIVFGIDRNAPKHDRWPLSASEWWWPGRNEEPLLFGEHAPHNCRDVFLDYLGSHPDELERAKAEYPNGPLAVTHLRGPTKIPCRYDAVYVSPEWAVGTVAHHFDESIWELSDHALVTAEIELQSALVKRRPK